MSFWVTKPFHVLFYSNPPPSRPIAPGRIVLPVVCAGFEFNKYITMRMLSHAAAILRKSSSSAHCGQALGWCALKTTLSILEG